MELRTGVSDYLFDRLGVRYIPKTELIITVGASEAIDLAFRATLNPGDEVIVPEPSFVCYKNIVELADGIPVVLDTKAENNFKITAEELVEKITDKTKAIILPYPNNPTGALMEKEDLAKIVEVLKDKDILVISDGNLFRAHIRWQKTCFYCFF